jgi:hypothetical protein
VAFLGPLNPRQLLAGVGRLLRAARKRARADHSTLARRQVRFTPHAMVRYYLYAAVAPSRGSQRPWDDQQVARAQRFAQSFCSAPWTAQPLTADSHVTSFGQKGADSQFERVLYVRSDGLIELNWALRCETTNGRRELEAVELARVAAALALAVAGPEYETLCRAGRFNRPVRRTDWMFGVSIAVPGNEGQQPWDALRFPGESPPRANDARAHMPQGGYGGDALRSLRRKRAPQKVPTGLVRELLAANGYHTVGNIPEELGAEGLRQASANLS